MKRLEGKVAVITGSTSGLGLATARRFAEEGAAVAVSSRRAEAADSVARELRAKGARAIGLACDVRDGAAVEALALAASRELGPIDVWINNAGVSAPYGRTLDVAPRDFEAATLTNILGAYHGSRAALMQMLPRARGKLINVLGRGERGPVPLQNAYAASKGWIRSFTRALAKEYRGQGVGVFTFQPGLMLTELTLQPLVVSGLEEKLAPLATVLRLWGKPPDAVAERLVWLASDDSDGRRRIASKGHGRWWTLAGPLRALLGGSPKPRLAPRVAPAP